MVSRFRCLRTYRQNSSGHQTDWWADNQYRYRYFCSTNVLWQRRHSGRKVSILWLGPRQPQHLRKEMSFRKLRKHQELKMRRGYLQPANAQSRGNKTPIAKVSWASSNYTTRITSSWPSYCSLFLCYNRFLELWFILLLQSWNMLLCDLKTRVVPTTGREVEPVLIQEFCRLFEGSL